MTPRRSANLSAPVPARCSHASRVVLSAAIGAFGCTERIEVLSTPPGVTPPIVDAGSDVSAGGASGAPDAGPPPVVLGTALQVSAGDAHTCATVDGRLYCWGANDRAQLGTGDVEAKFSPTRIGVDGDWSRVQTGDSHSCALKTAGALHCWGDNSFGQLGTGDNVARVTPAAVQTELRFVRFSAKFNNTCAISSDARLFCWGDNFEGNLGQNDGFPGENSSMPRQIGTDADWLDVSNGQGHACGLRAGGALWCWGRNTANELALGDTAADQIRTPTLASGSGWSELRVGQANTCALGADRSLWCAGPNTFFALGALPTANPIPSQVVPAAHTDFCIDTFSSCGIRDGGEMYCAGRGIEGQLGTGDVEERQVPTRIGAGFEQVTCGRFHTCAVLDGSIACTGGNDAGKLGVGDTERRREFTPVVLPP